MLILDESVAALDVSIQAQVLNLLADIRDETGVSYVLISHDLAVVRQLTDDASSCSAAAIVERGPSGAGARPPAGPVHAAAPRERAGAGLEADAASEVGTGPGDRPAADLDGWRLPVQRPRMPLWQVLQHADGAGARTGVRTGGLPGRPPDRRRSIGFVYLAHDATLRRRVALKVVAPSLAGDERYRKRFLAEARLAASLEHPAIVPIYAAGESDAQLYLAMRFLEEGSLADLLAERGRLPAATTVALLEPVAAALDAAHAAGLVHRDVKPANILLDHDRALLADFGLAMAASAESLLSADALHLSGTMGYVAPEQIEGDRAGSAADQYAFACVAFECLTGRRPFPRDTELAVIYAHISEPPPSAADLASDLPRAIDPVLARGLAKRPDQRFPSCGGSSRRSPPRAGSRRRARCRAPRGAAGRSSPQVQWLPWPPVPRRSAS